jgi:hypothetical protein
VDGRILRPTQSAVKVMRAPNRRSRIALLDFFHEILGR